MKRIVVCLFLAALTGLVQSQDEQPAIESLLRQEQESPDRREIKKDLAKLYYEKARRDDAENRRAEAKESYRNSAEYDRKAFALAPGEPGEYIRTAEILQYLGQTSAAVEMLTTARTVHPTDIPMRIALAEAFSAAREFGKALAEFKATEEEAKSTRPDLLDDSFYFSFGAAAERAGKFDLAGTYFKLAIDLIPADSDSIRVARAHNYLGYMWLEQGMNLPEAGEHILKANELLPDEGAFVDSLGWYYFLTKDYDKALTQLKHATALMDQTDPENAVVLDHLAQIHFALGHREEAIQELRKAVALAPKDATLSNRLRDYESQK